MYCKIYCNIWLFWNKLTLVLPMQGGRNVAWSARSWDGAKLTILSWFDFSKDFFGILRFLAFGDFWPFETEPNWIFLIGFWEPFICGNTSLLISSPLTQEFFCSSVAGHGEGFGNGKWSHFRARASEIKCKLPSDLPLQPYYLTS